MHNIKLLNILYKKITSGKISCLETRIKKKSIKNIPNFDWICLQFKFSVFYSVLRKGELRPVS